MVLTRIAWATIVTSASMVSYDLQVRVWHTVPRFPFLTLKGPKGAVRPLNLIMAISMIERRSAWYDIYDERGKKQKTLSESIGEVLGWAANFFVVRRSAWYDLYDESGKKYKTLSESIGSFVSISGDTFIVRRSAWLDTYDRTGKKINTRSAY